MDNNGYSGKIWRTSFPKSNHMFDSRVENPRFYQDLFRRFSEILRTYEDSDLFSRYEKYIVSYILAMIQTDQNTTLERLVSSMDYFYQTYLPKDIVEHNLQFLKTHEIESLLKHLTEKNIITMDVTGIKLVEA